jgi:hypothetical protein
MSNWLVEDHGGGCSISATTHEGESHLLHDSEKANYWREGMARFPNPG